jgi:hypothetical protein
MRLLETGGFRPVFPKKMDYFNKKI